jgi:hypothetical protein
MSLNDALIQQLQKVLQNNLNTYFRTATEAEKTPDKVFHNGFSERIARTSKIVGQGPSVSRHAAV